MVREVWQQQGEAASHLVSMGRRRESKSSAQLVAFSICFCLVQDPACRLMATVCCGFSSSGNSFEDSFTGRRQARDVILNPVGNED